MSGAWDLRSAVADVLVLILRQPDQRANGQLIVVPFQGHREPESDLFIWVVFQAHQRRLRTGGPRSEADGMRNAETGFYVR